MQVNRVFRIFPFSLPVTHNGECLYLFIGISLAQCAVCVCDQIVDVMDLCMTLLMSVVFSSFC